MDMPWDTNPSSTNKEKEFVPNPFFYHTDLTDHLYSVQTLPNGINATVFGLKVFIPIKIIKKHDSKTYVHTNTLHSIIGKAYIEFVRSQESEEKP